jgi:hypothetical protein
MMNPEFCLLLYKILFNIFIINFLFNQINLYEKINNYINYFNIKFV